MKKQRSNQGSSDSTNEDIFADFEPPNTTDGSYMGTMKHVKATEAHLERKFQEAFDKTNQRLKEAKARVSITRRGNSLQLQATLPPKPDSGKVNPYQQLVSLGIPANLDGLTTAQEEANELGKLLARKQFEWNEKYLGVKVEEVTIPTIGELLDKFEEKYFKTRKDTIKSKHTFSVVNRELKSALSSCRDKEATYLVFSEVLSNIPISIKKDSVTSYINVLCGCYGLEYKFQRVAKKDIQPRDRYIPTDREIVEKFALFEKRSESRPTVNIRHKDNWKFWRWTYGMLATYGLRPRELFVNPDITWWLSPENVNNTWKVDKLNKTGFRAALPLKQDWIELFDLKDPSSLEQLASMTSDLNIASLRTNVGIVSKWFKMLNLGFQPYDLRHAWAIRAHMLGIPIKVASDNLGHSVRMHTDIYQKHMGEENRKNAINQAIAKKSEVDLLRDENARLTIECDRLKLEVDRYRLMVNHPELTDR